MSEIDMALLESLRHFAVQLNDIAEEASELGDKLALIVKNAELAQYGLAVGDELFFTDEYRVADGLDKVPGWKHYIDHSEYLGDWLPPNEYDGGYLVLQDAQGNWTSGHPNIPVEMVQRMKAAAIERRQKDRPDAPAT